MKKLFSFIIIFLFIFIVSACNNKLEFLNYDIIHELEFGGVYIKITIDEFNNKGFSYGDSVNVEFSNNYKIEDIPYYNGYYVDAGESLLVGYPGYDYVKLAINYGDDYWDIAKLEESDKASIKLNQKAKYKDIQDTLNIAYKDDRSFYETDSEFANYRMVKVGNIKENILYRGASPCDNKHKRASTVDSLIANDQIKFIVNLADTKEKIDSYISMDDFNSPYFLKLYEGKKFFFGATLNEKIELLAMNMNYKSDEFRTKVASGFKRMLEFEGPYYVHCQEGKDRTGFVIIVIEALMGSTYQEIVDDYMETYNNYYKINKEKDLLRYNIIKERNVDAMLKFLINDENADLKTKEFSPYIRNYLKNGGMTDSEIDNFINILKKY